MDAWSWQLQPTLTEANCAINLNSRQERVAGAVASVKRGKCCVRQNLIRIGLHLIGNTLMSTLRRRNLKTRQSPVILDLCLRKTRPGKSRDHRDAIVFEKLCFQCFPSTRKRKAGVFKYLRFVERFGKAPLSWRIGVDSRPNHINKAAFSNFSGAVWTLHEMSKTVHF